MQEKIERFLNDLRIDPEISEGTTNVRYYDLKNFSEWLSSKGIDREITDLKASTLRSYLLRQKQEFSPNTVKNRYISLQELYKHALIDSDRENPIDSLKSGDFIPSRTSKNEEQIARDEMGLDFYLEEQEYRAMLDNVRGPKLRNRCILSVLYHCGLRAGEAKCLRVEHVDFEDEILTVPEVKTPERYVPLLASTINLLDKYLNHGYRDALVDRYSPVDYLFVSENGVQLADPVIRNVVDDSASKAGIQEVLYEDSGGCERKHVHPHLLRHTFGQRIANERQMPMPMLMRIMGHNDLQTAREYQRQDEQDAAESAKRFMRLSDD